MTNTKDSNSNNNSIKQQQQQQQETIKNLALSKNDKDLSKHLTELYNQRKEIQIGEAQANSHLRFAVHQLEEDVSKYKGQAKRLEVEKARLEKDQKATAEKISKINKEIEDCECALKVRKNAAKSGISEAEIIKNSEKAAAEGPKKFKPMISPEKAYDISGATEGYKQKTGQIPKDPNEDKEEDDDDDNGGGRKSKK